MFKNCILYTNCVGSLGIKPLFSLIPNFGPIKHFHNYNEDEYPSDEELATCDLFIFQYSTKEPIEKYTSKLPPNCKQVSFPYIYDDGTFSIHYGTGGFSVIDKLVQKGYSTEEILNMYDCNNIDFELNDRRMRSIQILKDRETKCTIKIADFIESNRDKPLFFTHNHPTMIITLELCNRICEQLHIPKFQEGLYGWQYGIHLDMTGFCHSPYDKLDSVLKSSMLSLDKYSVCNQVTCIHYKEDNIEDFYLQDDMFTRKAIMNYLKSLCN
jgi:hypothetical protein